MSGQPQTSPISFVGHMLVALRTVSLLIHLLVCIPVYLMFGPFTQHNPAARIFMAGVSRILGLKITIDGPRPSRGAFLVANHISWLDIPALTAMTGTAFVAHDGLAQFAWLRWLGSLNDTVFVARHDRASVARQVEQVRMAIRDTGALTIFPEGTTGNGMALLPFKSSLLSALSPVADGIAVIPVWVDYGPGAPEIAWFGTETGKDNFLKIAARRSPIPVTIHFLEPLDSSRLADRKTISAAAQAAIAKAMGSKPPETGGQRVAL